MFISCFSRFLVFLMMLICPLCLLTPFIFFLIYHRLVMMLILDLKLWIAHPFRLPELLWFISLLCHCQAFDRFTNWSSHSNNQIFILLFLIVPSKFFLKSCNQVYHQILMTYNNWKMLKFIKVDPYIEPKLELTSSST